MGAFLTLIVDEAVAVSVMESMPCPPFPQTDQGGLMKGSESSHFQNYTSPGSESSIIFRCDGGGAASDCQVLMS